MQSRWDIVKGVLGIFFIIAVLGTLIGIGYVGLGGNEPDTQRVEEGCVAEWVVDDPLMYAAIFVGDHGGLVELNGDSSGFAPGSDLQGAVWVSIDNQLILGVMTRTHAVDVIVRCISPEADVTFEIVRERER